MKAKIKMKDRFLNALIMGELGVKDSTGFIVTLREFKLYFRPKVKSNYVETFLPSVVIEKGRNGVTPTRYVVRKGKGVYHVGFDVVKEQIQKNILDEQKQADLSVNQARFEQAVKVHMAENHPDITV